MTHALTFTIPDMECGACLRAVTEAVHKLDAAAEVTADLDARRVTIAATREADFAAAITAAGFSPQAVG